MKGYGINILYDNITIITLHKSHLFDRGSLGTSLFLFSRIILNRGKYSVTILPMYPC